MEGPPRLLEGNIEAVAGHLPGRPLPRDLGGDKTQFHRSTERPATGCSSKWSIPRPATSSKATKGRGYELRSGKYVEIEPEELVAVQLESTRTIDIDKFVPESEIDKRYYDKPYYIVPNDKSGEEAFAVIRNASERQRARSSSANCLRRPRAHPGHRGLGKRHTRYDAALRLRSARRQREVFGDIPSPRVPRDMIELAGHILDSKAGRFEIYHQVKDKYEEALRKTRQTKSKRQDH